MRLGKRHIPLLGRYLLTVSTLGMLASDIQGQSKTAVSNFTSVASSTTSSPIRPLSIGDQVPDIVFENILNYKSKKARLSDFRGKLVILDMWSVYCTSCIAAFPEMEKLQKKFGDKIQILLVNPHDPKYDSEEKIKSTLEKFKTRTGFQSTLPIPIHDSILNSYFPHESVPHQIWIDDKGKVVAITGTSSATTKNIDAILNNKPISLSIKNDWVFDKTKPLPTGSDSNDANNIIYRSIITGYKEDFGFSNGVRKNEKNEIIGIYMLNKTLPDLIINEAYRDITKGYEKQRIFFDVINPVKFNYKLDTSYAYCYDLTIPPIKPESLDVKQYLKDDLKKVFNISVRIEKRTISTLIVTSTDKLKSLTTKHDKRESDLSKASIRKYLHNYSIPTVLKILEGCFQQPLINETGIENKIDIDFPDKFDFANTNSLLEILREIGFNIREEIREMDVIVVTDK